MTLLCGKINRTLGDLLISGQHIEMKELKKIYGFVPQDDVMHRNLTVKETLLHSARMRCPTDWTFQMINDHVTCVIKTLK
jgi:ABC-type multidrug transport system ATPase subunit